MSDGASPARTQNDETIDSILAEYLRRVDAGETVDREAFLAAHPESAAALKSYFETADVVEQMAGSLVSESIASDAQNRDDATLTLPSPDLQPPAPDPARDSTLRNQQATIVKVQSSLTGLETLPPLAGEQNQQKPSSSESPSGPAPEKIGRYRIEKVLGQGAMGVVYLAHDSNLGRRVALKIPRFTEADGHEFIERFYREARTAANLRSPHICPVYDVGEIDGAPFITMAFIEGKPLSDYIRPACPQPERQVAGVVRKLAVALDEAHRAGIVHRDLKPANIMVDTRGEPIIMDFGLAREMSADPESTRLTHFGMMIGTPAYMPPEQVNGENDLVGPRSDIYALGVILYELLTGRIPFQGSLAAVLGQILTVEPVPPSQLRPDLDPRIETICLKLMSKKMEDRPGSMKEVAGMLTEYLRSPRSQSSAAPTVIETPATPPPTRSIASRDRLKETPKVEIDAIGRTARRLFAKHDYEQAAQLLSQIPETARTEKHSELLQECIERNDEVNFLIARLQDGLSRNQVMGLDNIVSRLLELKPGNRLGIEARERVAQAALRRRRVTMSRPMGLGSIPPAVQWITLWLAFFGFMYGMVIIYVKRGDKETKVIGSLEPGEEFEAVVRSGADGETTIEMKARTAGMIPSERKPAAKVSPRALHPAVSTIGSAPGISSTYRFVEVRQLSGHTASISCVAFFPDGERAVSGSHDKTLRIWNVRDGKELFRLNHNRNTTSVAVSPDGSRIASAHIGGEVNVWDVATRANVLKIPRSQQLVSAVRFSRDGKSIVFGSRGHFAAVWEIAGKREVKRFETGDTGWIHGVEFLPDGRSALAGTTDGRLIQWNVETGNAIRTIRQFPSWIEAIACSADGKRIACGGLQAGKESPNRIWDFASGIELARFEGHTDCVEGVAFALGDRCVVTGSQDRTLRLWDAGTGAELARAESKTHVMHHLAVAPDGSQVLTGGGLYNVPDKPTSDDRDYQLRLWRITEAASPKPTAAPSPAVAGRMGAIHVLNGHTKSINDLAISPDGRWLASCGHDQTVRVWDLSSGQEVKLINGHFNAAVFTPDGKRLILGQDNQNPRSEIRLISVDDWKEVHAVKEAGKTVNDLAVSSDGKMLLSSHPGGVRLWNLESRQLIRYFEKPSDRAIARVAFDSSNRHAFGAAGHDKFVRWEVQSGRIVSTHSRPWSDTAALSNDGKLLVVPDWSWEGIVSLLNFETGELVKKIKLRHKGSSLRGIAISNNQKYVIAGADSNEVLLTSVESGEQIQIFTGHTDAVHHIVLTPDNRFAITASNDRYDNDKKKMVDGVDSSIRIWPMPPQVYGEETAVAATSTNTTTPPPLPALLKPSSSSPKGEITGATLRWKLGGDADTFGPRATWVKFSPDGRYLASTWGTKPPKIIDVASGKIVREVASGSFAGMTFARDSKSAVLFRHDDKPALLKFEDGSQEAVSFPVDRGFRDGDFLKNGQLLLTNEYRGGRFALLNWPSGETVVQQEMAGEEGAYRQAYTPDGRLIVFGTGRSATVLVWDIQKSEKLAEFRAHPEPHWLTGMTFSASGQILATCSHEGTIKLWEPESGRMVEQFIHGIGDWLEEVAFTPDDRYLAVATHTNGYWLWDVAARKVAHKIPAHDLSGSGLGISPDGRFVATASARHNSSNHPPPKNPEGFAEIHLWELQRSPTP